MPNEIQKQLEKYGIGPNKVLGQNFLIDQDSVMSFVEAADITKEDTVIEVGPGTGAITKELTKRAGRVVAVEKDPNMVKILEDELKGFGNVEVVNEDILRFDPASYISNGVSYKLIGAPPYYLTARLFRKFLEEAKVKPQAIAVIIQKEVSEKICTKPPDMTLLAVSVQLYGDCKIEKKIPKSMFWPQPKVDSAILTVGNIQKPDIDEPRFFRVVRAGFSSPRKQLAGNLSNNLRIERFDVEKILKKHGILPQQRAETLSVDSWLKLASEL